VELERELVKVEVFVVTIVAVEVKASLESDMVEVVAFVSRFALSS
jgi:hypothetical protein